MEEITIKAVEELRHDGKSYVLCYRERPVVEVTLEAGDEMNERTAFAIINDVFVNSFHKPPRQYPELVSFREIESET